VDTIHIVVVDPGVGTARRALLLLTPTGRFLAPDNGVLSYVLDRYVTDATSNEALPPSCKAYALDKPDYWRNPVSATFHGRDIFAPVASHLSLGEPPEEMGTPVLSVTCLAITRPAWDEDTLTGRVAHIDRFGNLVTDIPEGLVAGRSGLIVHVAGRDIEGLSATYAEGAGLLAIIGSLGYLEVSVTGGSAARTLGVGIGDAVSVRRSPGNG
jgi:S-adenosylmethionine hydrolase